MHVDRDNVEKTKMLETLQEEQAANQERLFDLEKRYVNANVYVYGSHTHTHTHTYARAHTHTHAVDTRAAKAEEERRRLELQAIQRAAEERDYRAATLLQVCFLLLFLVLYSTHNMMP
jgi:ABC-type nickel/cobalt efflux system permease component RcnA